MRWMKTCFLALVFSLSVTTAFAQGPGFRDALLNHFVGRWVLHGTILGQNAIHDINAHWVLGHQYLQFDQISREHNPDGSPTYESIVYIGWDQSDSEYVWAGFDGFGGFSSENIGRAKRETNTIPFVFQDPGSTFHQTFSYIPSTDSWKWRLVFDKNGVSKSFGTVTLTRVK